MKVKNKCKTKNVIVRMEQDEVDRVDLIAKEYYRGTSRSQAIRLLVEDRWVEMMKNKVQGIA